MQQNYLSEKMKHGGNDVMQEFEKLSGTVFL